MHIAWLCVCTELYYEQIKQEKLSSSCSCQARCIVLVAAIYDTKYCPPIHSGPTQSMAEAPKDDVSTQQAAVIKNFTCT